MAKSKLAQANQKIAEGVTGGFQKMSDGVVGVYKKVEDAFVDRYLTHEGESVDEAKARLQTEQTSRDAQNEAFAAQAKAQGGDVLEQTQEKIKQLQSRK